MNFSQTLQAHNLELRRTQTRVLQINVGKKCNQTCAHCHVNAGPHRREMMTRQVAEKIIAWLAQTAIPIVDITGGAPELNPNFRYLVEAARSLNRHVMDRCNLTVLFEPEPDDLADFLAQNEVEIVASLPCYESENVDAQRGDGVFEKSIRGLQLLNSLGYGTNPKLPLNLVYNPLGAHLPGPQAMLEATYKAELGRNFGISFNHLFTLTNMPIERFGAHLRRENLWHEYQELLLQSFNPASVAGLMCRDTINVGWQGDVFDCDFNQMLRLSWSDAPVYVWQLDPHALEGRAIATGKHCFGCTAGAGSSCGGALT